MKYEINYLSCGQCQARIHCEDCGIKLMESALNMPGVASAHFNLPEKSMRLELNPGADEGDILDALENLGVLV